MIEVIRYREVEDKGAVKANLTVKMHKWGTFCINLVLFEKDGKRWVNFPQKVVEQEGQKKYIPEAWFEDKKLSGDFQNSVLKAIYEYLTKKPTTIQKQDTQARETAFDYYERGSKPANAVYEPSNEVPF